MTGEIRGYDEVIELDSGLIFIKKLRGGEGEK